ncbi:Gag polyprotein [Senna tora]|uniref:Gag polyprotein n=1 Tax=Senna tora TaxID=362788 RepID=A0A834W1F2_9FABA|nr:Gag polyprotein [Senna tora]
MSKFYSYLRHNPDEAWKAMHVTSTLNTAMRNVVAPLAIKSYAKLVDRCRIVALNIKVAEKNKQKDNFNNKRPITSLKAETTKARSLCWEIMYQILAPSVEEVMEADHVCLDKVFAIIVGNPDNLLRIVPSRTRQELKLPVTTLPFDLAISTPTGECIDVILGMNWLSENHVVLNCCDKSVTFIDPIPSVNEMRRKFKE